MSTQDPMCKQVYDANPNAVWNWNGLYKNGVGGQHQSAAPDGHLCSGGGAEGGRYASLDKPGNWGATKVSPQFTFSLLDTANHGYDYVRLYVSKPGYNPASQPLTWGNLTRAGGSEKKTPASAYPSRNPDGSVATFQVDAGAGRTGRAVLFMVWQASHMDQAFYGCSDVQF